jgi:hypothetical protein
MSGREQALLWASADMVVHVHGAAQGSWLFLPRQAVVVHVVQHPGGVIHDNSYAEQLVRPPVPRWLRAGRAMGTFAPGTFAMGTFAPI